MKLIKQLKIEKLVYKGLGLGFHNANPVFVSYAAPNDVIDVEVISERRKVVFGKIHKIIQPSPARVKPDCEVFGKCGGCDWLNISYKEQLNCKQTIVEEIFSSIEIVKINKIISSGEKPYRNKCFFPVSKQNGKPVAGMFASRSHNVVPHKNCELQPAFFDEITKLVLSYVEASKLQVYDEKNHSGNLRHVGIRYAMQTDEVIVILVTKSRKLPFSKQLERVLLTRFPNIVGIIQNINNKKTNVILGDDEKVIYGRDFLFEQLGSIKYKLNYRSFFQVNTKQAISMYKFVKNNITKNSKVIDAYCGVGSIGLYISENAAEVIGIESNGNAVKNAKENAELNKIGNCRFITGYVDAELSKLLQSNDIDTIIFDPPRKGLEQKIIESLNKNINKIIYISCDPMTQVRDVKMIISKGFKPTIMQPFDMFPHTYHIENVLILERN